MNEAWFSVSRVVVVAVWSWGCLTILIDDFRLHQFSFRFYIVKVLIASVIALIGFGGIETIRRLP